MTASELANLLGSDNEEAVRQTVSRIRSSLTQGCGAPVLPPNGLIETVRGRGYRLNPVTVSLVALGEIRSS
jgi:DNA-binding winged helix-turn-helix (wHTH) protein